MTEIRRRNLDVLASEAESLEAMADAMRRAKGTDKNYANTLSQLRGGHRNIGHRMARDLESAMGKTKGWMDIPHWDAIDATMEQKEAADLVRSLSAEDREAWMAMGRALNRKGPARAGSPFAGVPLGEASAKPADTRTTAGRKAGRKQARKRGPQ